MNAAASTASAASLTGSVVPTATGTPAAATRFRALILSPICSMADGGGPTQVSPASMTAWANGPFSERKP